MDLQTNDGAALNAVIVGLTRAEATELRDAVASLLERFDEPDFHVHVSSADYQSELTLMSSPRP